MKSLLALLFSLTFFNLFSQTIKTYTGPYELIKIKYYQYSTEYRDEKFLEGTATYTYYNKGDERVYQGAFKYTSKTVDGQTMHLQGSFKNGLKTSVWNMSIVSNETYTNNAGKASILGSEKLNGSFVEGLRTGIWTYSKNLNSSISLYNVYTKQYSTQKNKVEIINSTASFKQGKFCNTFSYTSNITNNGQSEKISINGAFDDKCCMTGQWIANIGIEQVIERFKGGVNTSYILKNVGTGTIIEKDTILDGEPVLYNQYLKNPNTDITGLTICEFCRYYKKGSGGEIFNQWIYYTPGSSQENQGIIASNTMKNIGTLVERQAKEAEELRLREIADKRELENIKNENEYKELSACKDINEIDAFIQKYPNSIYRSVALKSMYDQLNYIVDFKTYISRYPDSPYKANAQTDIYNSCNTIACLQLFINDYPDYNKINEVKYTLNNLQKRYIDNIFPKNNQLRYDVKDKYIIVNQGITKYHKKNVYNAGIMLYEQYNDKYITAVNNNDYDNAIVALDYCAVILNKLMELSAIEDTKELEKQLKNVDDIDQIKLLLNI